MSDADDAQPPSAAPSATTPKLRIFMKLPRPAGIQPQLAVERNGRFAKVGGKLCLCSLLLVSARPAVVLALKILRSKNTYD